MSSQVKGVMLYLWMMLYRAKQTGWWVSGRRVEEAAVIVRELELLEVWAGQPMAQRAMLQRSLGIVRVEEQAS